MGNESKLTGVAAVLSVDHSVALMPLFTGETTVKGDEWVGNMRWSLARGQLESISGRCKTEKDETLEEAMRREAVEERGMSGIDVGQLLPDVVVVGQERNGIPVEFLVHLFWSNLTPEQVSDLQAEQQLEIVGRESLGRYMADKGTQAFRPSVWAMLQLACNTGFWGNNV